MTRETSTSTRAALASEPAGSTRSLPRKLRRPASSPAPSGRRARPVTPAARTLAFSQEEFAAHTSNVTCLSLGHKSGRVLVTGGDDKKVNLWAVGKPNCIMSLSGHTTPIESVRFGHTEELVCAGSASGALKIWDLEAARLVRTLTGHKNSIRCIDFHPYGDFLASGSSDTNIKLWDIRRRGCIFTYKGHSQMVNSLKFSPDGQWIASAGEDGGVKLWDLRAGKMLTELPRHSGPVSDVQFHPHEFLMASAGLDRVVNFWDLENFQLVSSSDGDGGPVRCIAFGGEGECLFAGCHDLLKVYGWEPFRSYDTVSLGWGRIADIAVAQTQLVGVTFHSTNVAIYVVDLKRVQPFGKPPPSAENQLPSVEPNPFRHGQHIRKSFVKEKPPDGNGNDMKTEECSDTNVNTDPEEDTPSLVDVRDVDDYTAIFRPRNRALSRTPPPAEEPAAPAPAAPLPAPSRGTPHRTARTRPPPATDYPSAVQQQRQQSSSAHFQAPPSPARTGSLATAKQAVYHSNPDIRPDSVPIPTEPYRFAGPVRHSPSEPVIPQPAGGSSAAAASQLYSVSAAAAPRPPQPEVLHRPPAAPAPARPPQQQEKQPLPPPPPPLEEDQLSPTESRNIVPMMGDRPAGLEIDDFLPNKFSGLSLGGAGGGMFAAQSAVSEAEALTSVVKGHGSMMAVLTSRQRQLEISHTLWCQKDAKTSMEHVVARNDLAVIVDLLSQLNLRPSIWNLDICQVLLPSVLELLQSKYEMYMTVGCNTLKLILKNFAHMIKTNLASPVYTHGVDISREERYNKCKLCYDQLLSIRAFLLKRQTLQGKIGQTFRELHILMQALD